MTDSSAYEPSPPNLRSKRLSEIVQARSERPWRYYAPVPKVRDGFHVSKAPYRLLHGPNGGGKTWAGAAETVAFATGYNHFRDEHYPTPNRCWAVCLDRINQQPVMERALARMLPKGYKWKERDQTFVLPPPWNSEIQVKAIDPGDANKFTADRILSAWFDEEWPGENGLAVWKETMRRTQPGWDLRLFMTLTPTQGYTWTYDYLYRKGPKQFLGTETFNYTIYDCHVDRGGFLSQSDIEREERKCQSAADRAIRLMGQYHPIGLNPAFPGDQLMAAMDRALDGKRYTVTMVEVPGVGPSPVLKEDPTGEIVVLVPPQKGRQYILGADPSMGVGRDRAAAVILDCALPVECAYFASNRMPPARFAREVIAPLASYYNGALAAVESNSEAGGAVLALLPQYYGNIYMRQDFNTRDRSFRREYGFRTDGHTRGLVWSTLRDILPLSNCILSEDAIRELSDLVADGERIDHPEGKNDDHAFALGIAAAVNRLNPPVRYEPWESYREEYRGENAWMGT